MDITVMTQLINNIGFPIAVAIGLGWYIIYLRKSHVTEKTLIREQNEKYVNLINEQYKILFDELKKSIDNNTASLNAMREALKNGN